MFQLAPFLHELWQQYVEITPQAKDIHKLLMTHGESIENDHVAFRTFANSPIELQTLERNLKGLGFEYFDEYHFPNKHLYARSYVHPDSQVKIFFSELLWQELSSISQAIIQPYINAIKKKQAYSLMSGRLWPMPSYRDYLDLQEESEYAAWLLAWGLRANHFTILVNQLNQFDSMHKLVGLLKNEAYLLNEQGGEIKGNQQQGLMQASTMADKIEVTFSCGKTVRVASCYYEFAQRFNPDNIQSTDDLYQGFVVSSADNIFESTSDRQVQPK